MARRYVFGISGGRHDELLEVGFRRGGKRRDEFKLCFNTVRYWKVIANFTTSRDYVRASMLNKYKSHHLLLILRSLFCTIQGSTLFAFQCLDHDMLPKAVL